MHSGVRIPPPQPEMSSRISHPQPKFVPKETVVEPVELALKDMLEYTKANWDHILLLINTFGLSGIVYDRFIKNRPNIKATINDGWFSYTQTKGLEIEMSVELLNQGNIPLSIREISESFEFTTKDVDLTNTVIPTFKSQIVRMFYSTKLSFSGKQRKDLLLSPGESKMVMLNTPGVRSDPPMLPDGVKYLFVKVVIRTSRKKMAIRKFIVLKRSTRSYV